MILKEKILILIILILLINSTNCQPANGNNNIDDGEKFLSKLKLLDYLSKNLNSNEETS